MTTSRPLGFDDAPRRRPDVVGVEVDGEAVLYDSRDGALHRLNPVATVLWHCLDGSVTLGELAEDLRTAVPDAVGGADGVLDYARQLDALGLLGGTGEKSGAG